MKSFNSFVKSIKIPRDTCNDIYYTSFDLSPFILLESIEIDSNNFCSVQTFRIDKMYLLERLIVKDNSFAKYINTSNKYDNRIFHISNCVSLFLIEIGSHCFGSVQTFRIEGLNRLNTIMIGNNSFTQINRSVPKRYKSKSFHILNCESLESIQIGEYSFSGFGGEFELTNLPQLQSIQIGTIGNNSYNYCYSSFIISGIELIMNI